MDAKNAVKRLTDINDKIRTAEWDRDLDYMNEILDDELTFKRANGDGLRHSATQWRMASMSTTTLASLIPLALAVCGWC